MFSLFCESKRHSRLLILPKLFLFTSLLFCSISLIIDDPNTHRQKYITANVNNNNAIILFYTPYQLILPLLQKTVLLLDFSKHDLHKYPPCVNSGNSLILDES